MVPVPSLTTSACQAVAALLVSLTLSQRTCQDSPINIQLLVQLPSQLRWHVLQLLVQTRTLCDESFRWLWCAELSGLGCTLSVANCPHITAANLAKTLVDVFQQPTSLPHAWSADPLPARLTCLGLAGITNTRDLDVFNIGKACPSITSLDLSKCLNITSTAVTYLQQTLGPSLQSLKLSGCWQVSSIQPLCLCAQLRSLHLCDCRQIQDSEVVHVLSRCTNLEQLSVKGVERITDAAFQPIISAGGLIGRQLTLLDASSTAISSNLIPQLMLFCPALASLSVSNCRQVDAIGITLAARIRSMQLIALQAASYDCFSIQRTAQEHGSKHAEALLLSAGHGSNRSEMLLDTGHAASDVAVSSAEVRPSPTIAAEQNRASAAHIGWAPASHPSAATTSMPGIHGSSAASGVAAMAAGPQAPGATTTATDPIVQNSAVLVPQGTATGPILQHSSASLLEGTATESQNNDSPAAALQGTTTEAMSQDPPMRAPHQAATTTVAHGDSAVTMSKVMAAAPWQHLGAANLHTDDDSYVLVIGDPATVQLQQLFELFCKHQLDAAANLDDESDVVDAVLCMDGGLDGWFVDRRLAASLTSLELSGCSKVTDLMLSEIGSTCSSLTSLNISHCTSISDAGLQHLSALTALTRLDISGCSGSRAVQAPGSAFRRPGGAGHPAKRLQRGGVTDSGLVPLLRALCTAASDHEDTKHSSRSSSTTLWSAGGGTADHPVRAIGQWHSAEQSNVDETDSSEAGKHYQTSRTSSATAGSMLPQGHGRPVGLRFLSIGQTNMTDAALQAMSSLTAVDLQRCKHITDTGILQLLHNCPKLKSLNLSGCSSNLTAAALGCSMHAWDKQQPTPALSHPTGTSMALQQPTSTVSHAAGAPMGWQQQTQHCHVSHSANHGTATVSSIGHAYLSANTGANTTSSSGTTPGPGAKSGASAVSRITHVTKLTLPKGMCRPNTITWLTEQLQIQGDTLISTPRPASFAVLTHLELARAASIPAQSLVALCQHAPLLRTLFLRDAHQVDDDAVHEILLSCPLLQKLAVTNSPLITDRLLHTLFLNTTEVAPATGMADSPTLSLGRRVTCTDLKDKQLERHFVPETTAMGTHPFSAATAIGSYLAPEPTAMQSHLYPENTAMECHPDLEVTASECHLALEALAQDSHATAQAAVLAPSVPPATITADQHIPFQLPSSSTHKLESPRMLPEHNAHAAASDAASALRLPTVVEAGGVLPDMDTLLQPSVDQAGSPAAGIAENAFMHDEAEVGTATDEAQEETPTMQDLQFQLHTLDLSGCTKLTAAGLLPPHTVCMRCLDVSHRTAGHQDWIIHVPASHMTGMQPEHEAFINRPSEMASHSGSDAERLVQTGNLHAKQQQALTKLQLDGCKRLTADSLCALVCLCPNLKEVYLRDIPAASSVTARIWQLGSHLRVVCTSHVPSAW